ncbi:hypothetical protein [Sphingomonas sp. R86521]
MLFSFLGKAVDDHGFDGRQDIGEQVKIDVERLTHRHDRAEIERERRAA